MACYVTSDIHGCYEQFIRLLHKISFSQDDTLYILGDIIDRGPDSVDMIRWVMQAPPNVHFMLGNHEQMMLDDTHGDYRTMRIEHDSTWDINGGAETATQHDAISGCVQPPLGERRMVLFGLRPARADSLRAHTDRHHREEGEALRHPSVETIAAECGAW